MISIHVASRGPSGELSIVTKTVPNPSGPLMIENTKHDIVNFIHFRHADTYIKMLFKILADAVVESV